MILKQLIPKINLFTSNVTFSTTQINQHVHKLTRMRVVDNSKLAMEGMIFRRSPRIIHVYTKTGLAKVGDKILLAIKGQKQKAIVVGCKGLERKPGVPYFDTNNCVLIDDADNPLGTRITVPIPALLRKRENCAKLIAISSSFV